MRQVPLFSKVDNKIVGWAKIDDDDLENVQRYRWLLTIDGQAVRKHPNGMRLLARHVLDVDLGGDEIVIHLDGDLLNCQKENLRVDTRPDDSE